MEYNQEPFLRKEEREVILGAKRGSTPSGWHRYRCEGSRGLGKQGRANLVELEAWEIRPWGSGMRKQAGTFPRLAKRGAQWYRHRNMCCLEEDHRPLPLGNVVIQVVYV